MAFVKNEISEEILFFHSQHTIGRDKSNTSCFEEKDISRKHAIIHWENHRWYLTDFSSNGTKVNNQHIHHATKQLELNDVIQFSQNQDYKWKLINIGIPCSFLKSVDGNKVIDLRDGIALSQEEDMSWSIIKDRNQNWIIDNEGVETILEDRKRYSIEGVEYEFIENEPLENTVQYNNVVKTANLQFLLSTDEETINVKIQVSDMEIDIGHRTCNHLLLLLARAKKNDSDINTTNPDLAGWVDVEILKKALSKELLKAIDDVNINVMIHRLRKCLMTHPPYGHLFANIIERKRGKLRFNLTNFEILKEEKLNK